MISVGGEWEMGGCDCDGMILIDGWLLNKIGEDLMHDDPAG